MSVAWTIKFEGRKSVSYLQDFGISNSLAFGTPTYPKVRLRYIFSALGTTALKDILSIKVRILTGASAPTGTLSAELRKHSDDTLIATSKESYAPSSSYVDYVDLTFDLDDYAVGHAINYDFVIVLIVSSTSTNPWYISGKTPNQNNDIYTELWNGSTWINQDTETYAELYGIELKEFDITSYVRNIKIDMGKNDVDGNYVEGQCDLTLRNKDGRFNPELSSSPYYPYWDVKSKVVITAVYSSVTYYVFAGYITRIRPDVEFAKRSCFVSCSDLFFPFKGEKVTVAMGANLRADQIITKVFEAMKLRTDLYDLDTSDQQLLKNKTWTEVDAISILEEVVEVGQHHHFVNGQGIYKFKSNTWLGGVDPDYTWDEGDVDDFKIENDVKGIYNRFRVQYPTSQWEESKNQQSIIQYGQRDFELSNDLMLDAAHAGEIAWGLRGRYSYRIKGADFILKNRFPEVLNVDIGTVIDFSESYSGLSNIKFIVFGLEKSINPTGDYELTLRTKRYYAPPYYFEVSEDVAAQNPAIAISYNFGQQFKLPFDARIFEVIVKYERISWAYAHSGLLRFFRDASGQLGENLGLIGLSQATIPAGSGTTEVVFSIYDWSNVSFEFKKDTLYWALLGVTGGPSDPGATWKLWGDSGDPEPDLKAIYYDSGVPGYVENVGIDYWLKIKVYPQGET